MDTWIDGFMGSVERRDCEGGGPTKGAIESVGHSHMECGGKRSATPLWLERLVLRWIRYKQKPKRRRASLAAALHMAVAGTFNRTLRWSPALTVSTLDTSHKSINPRIHSSSILSERGAALQAAPPNHSTQHYH